MIEFCAMQFFISKFKKIIVTTKLSNIPSFEFPEDDSISGSNSLLAFTIHLHRSRIWTVLAPWERKLFVLLFELLGVPSNTPLRHFCFK